MNKSITIFLHFINRDMRVYRKQLHNFIINYVVLFPLIFSFGFAYLGPNIVFKHQGPEVGAILLSGTLLLITLVCSYKLAIPLLFDMESNKFISYQISLLNPRLVILERIIFTGMFTFFLIVPFFAMAKLFLGNYLDTTNTSWPSLIIVLLLGSMCASSYNILASCIIPTPYHIRNFWVRFIQFVLTFVVFCFYCTQLKLTHLYLVM